MKLFAIAAVAASALLATSAFARGHGGYAPSVTVMAVAALPVARRASARGGSGVAGSAGGGVTD